MEKLIGLAEKAMGMNDENWARHANPWSGWSRVSVLPLLALALWSRVSIGWWSIVAVAAVLIWTWINPRLFAPPSSTENWMSRGVLGERIWLRRQGDTLLSHHRAVVQTLTALGIAGTALLIYGLTVLNLLPTILGLSVAMLSKLWFLDRMVWIHRETQAGTQMAEDAADNAGKPRR